MYAVEIYARVRRAVLVEGRSQRSVAREFGLARDTVRKMLEYSILPGYRRKEPAKRPKLGTWVGVIDAIQEDDKQRPKKQRHPSEQTILTWGISAGWVGDPVSGCERWQR